MTENATLVVINVAVKTDEHGYRLGWTIDKGQTYTPAIDLNTSKPFLTEREAVKYGEQKWGQTPKRLTRTGLVNIKYGTPD